MPSLLVSADQFGFNSVKIINGGGSNITTNVGTINNVNNYDQSLNKSDNVQFQNIIATGNVSFKRPYGSYSSTQTQNITAINTPYPVTFNWTDDDYLFTKSSDNSNFTAQATGDYLIVISAIAQSTTPGARVQIWLQKNGADVPRTNTIYDFKGSNANTVIAVPFMIDLNTTDKFRIMWAGDNTGIKLIYLTNTSYSPETPSVIMTVTKMSEVTP